MLTKLPRIVIPSIQQNKFGTRTAFAPPKTVGQSVGFKSRPNYKKKKTMKLYALTMPEKNLLKLIKGMIIEII